jgi:hypothetical protein
MLENRLPMLESRIAGTEAEPHTMPDVGGTEVPNVTWNGFG